MARILDTVKPLVARGTSLAASTFAKVPGPAGRLAERLGVGQRGSSPSGPMVGMTDQTVKSKVESALYRVPGVTRSKVKVSVADGIATVHGEAKNRAQTATIETAVRSVPEVRDYESRLHLPEPPAPSTPKAGARKATTSKPTASTKAATRGRTERVDRDKTSATGGPAPKSAEGSGAAKPKTAGTGPGAAKPKTASTRPAAAKPKTASTRPAAAKPKTATTDPGANKPKTAGTGPGAGEPAGPGSGSSGTQADSPASSLTSGSEAES